MFNRLRRVVTPKGNLQRLEPGKFSGAAATEGNAAKKLSPLPFDLPVPTPVFSVTAPASVAVQVGCSLKADTWFFEPTSVFGTLSGKINSSSDVHVARGASVSGEIRVKRLIVLGEVDGDLYVDVLEVRSGAVVKGTITAKQCIVTSNTTIKAEFLLAA